MRIQKQKPPWYVAQDFIYFIIEYSRDYMRNAEVSLRFRISFRFDAFLASFTLIIALSALSFAVFH